MLLNLWEAKGNLPGTLIALDEPSSDRGRYDGDDSVKYSTIVAARRLK